MAETVSALPDSDAYVKAVKVLRQGGIVAYPTETYYGLAVDPANGKALETLYRLKKRDQQKALTFIIPDLLSLPCHIAYTPAIYSKLIASFWPGPLTLIFDANDNCLLPFKKDDKSLAIRISSNPIAQKLCCLWGNALTASSANISGEPALNSAEAVRKQWGQQIDYILDGGLTAGGKASTIVHGNKSEITIIRHGVIPEKQIRNVLPKRYTICNVKDFGIAFTKEL